MGRRTLVPVLAAALLLTSCGSSTTSGAEEYEPLPASAWPTLEGVTVVSSDGYQGHSCCEPRLGGRSIELAVAGSGGDPLAVVEAGLLDAGWSPESCVRKVICLEHEGEIAFLYEASRKEHARGVDVTVNLERDPLA